MRSHWISLILPPKTLDVHSSNGSSVSYSTQHLEEMGRKNNEVVVVSTLSEQRVRNALVVGEPKKNTPGDRHAL